MQPRGVWLVATLVGACATGGNAGIDATGDSASGATVTITLAGTGTGQVTSSPAGIDCPGACSHGYSPGAMITLHAEPGVGASFVGWTAGRCVGTGDCTLEVGSDLSVEATFTIDRALTVVKSGTGTGMVTSSPAGVSCGTFCTAVFDDQQVVTLTAAADSGSTFTGWSGGGCTGTGTCTVTMTQDLTVTATFSPIQRTLTVTRSGSGTGTVTSAPAGIDCGATCSHAYDHGTMVVLTATPAGGSAFVGWSAPCAGTGTCTVNMGIDLTVGATFSSGTLSCTLVNTAVSCTNGAISEINLGPLTGPQCQAACPGQMVGAGMSSGCWIVAVDTNCYCRSGTLNLGSNRPGGVCS